MSTEVSTHAPTLKELSHSIARELTRGKSQAAVISQLVKRGWPETTARQFVYNAARLSNVYRELADECQCLADKCKRRIIRGGLWTAAGVGITAVSITAGDVHLGFCVFTVGVTLTIVESIDFMRGLVGWWQYRHTH